MLSVSSGQEKVKTNYKQWKVKEFTAVLHWSRGIINFVTFTTIKTPPHFTDYDFALQPYDHF